MIQRIRDIRNQVRSDRPLIHCITNPISINQCANAVLAVGGRPIMAEHPKEVREITETANALMLNLGNITDARMESMQYAAETAQARKISIVLDAVGIACSTLRRAYVCGLLRSVTPTVIKGNYSEIHALYHAAYRSSGVDADSGLDEHAADLAAVALARSYHTCVLASGKVDIITDGSRLVHIKNGTPQLASITGTGCMLGALTAAYLSASPGMDAVFCAISGQLAETDRGSGSFLMNLLDALSTLKDETIEQYLDWEEIDIEAL